MIPDLEQMILDLEGRGWRISELRWELCYYHLELRGYDEEGIYLGNTKFYTDQQTILECIKEAWRKCK